MMRILIALILCLVLSGCALFPQTLEKENILRAFDMDKRNLIEAMGKSGFGIFDAARLINDYAETYSNYSLDGFKVYLFDYLEKSHNWGGGGYADKLWKEIMINYELLRNLKRG